MCRSARSEQKIRTMIITRKIEVFVNEDDKDLRRSYYEKLYDMRNAARHAANLTSSHSFILDNAIPYLSEEDKEKLTFLGATGEQASKANAAYTAVSKKYKGEISMGMLSNVVQNARKCYQADFVDVMTGKRSIRSYRSNLPIPFQKKAFSFRADDRDIYFTLEKIPFQMKFGKDRSGNRVIVNRVISGEYKMATSSIVLDDKRKKTYLYLCVDIPQKENKLKKDKVLYAYLGIHNPIVCSTEVCTPYERNQTKVWEISTSEEFFHKRRQIQESLRRAQITAKWNKGGKSRYYKTKNIEHFKKKELNYVTTKIHQYTKELVRIAIDHECDTIVLANQKGREEALKEAAEKKDNECTERDLKRKIVFRNWSYSGLKDKIKYKAKMNGITVRIDGKE